jgi:lysophospholipase L1-like esterase
MRIGAVTLAVLAVATLAELALRTAGYDPLRELAGARHRFVQLVPDPDLQYGLLPDAVHRGKRVTIRINRHGFRDRNHALAKPPGTARLVVLGDSITFAASRPVEERFTEKLELLLRSPSRPVEVLNLGVGGYDVLNEVAFLEQVGLGFDPDWVVVAWCINDLGIHSLNLRTLRFLDQYGWWTRSSRLAQLFVVRAETLGLEEQFAEQNRDEVFRRIHAGRIAEVSDDGELRRLVAELEGQLRTSTRRADPGFLDWYTSDAKLGRLRYAFERLARITADRDLPVLVAMIPYLEEGQLGDAYRQAYALVEHEAARVGFDVLNLRDAFLRYGLERVRTRNWLHPNAEGHELIASELHRHLRDRL